MRHDGKHGGALIAALWCLAVCGGAAGQRLIVATTTLSASREAARVYMQSVDMEVGAPLPGPEVLPGLGPVGPLFLATHGGPHSLAIVSTGPRWHGGDPAAGREETDVSGFRSAPFARSGGFRFAKGWRGFAAYMARGATTGEPVLVAVGYRMDEEGRWQGALAAHHTSGGPAPFFEAGPTRWAFPGVPVAAVGMPPRDRVVVLCRGPYGQGCVLRAIDHFTQSTHSDAYPLSGAVLSREMVDESSHFGTVPSGLALSGDGSRLFVLRSGYAEQSPSGEPVSWLHALEPDRLEDLHPPLELPGTADVAACALRPTGAASCWVATRRKGTEFAYATLVRVTPEGLVKDAYVPLTGVAGSFHIEASPDGAEAAVAMDARLERWENGRRTDTWAGYDGPIGVVRWTSGGLFVGEAGRVHHVHPQTMRPVRTVQLQSGWVTDLVQVPFADLPSPDLDGDGLALEDEERLGTSPLSADSDGDGIPDGSDPDPLVPSPRLRLPSAVGFRDAATGQELKALVIDSPYGQGYSWGVDFDGAALPWLLAHPVSGTLPGVVYLGVDPARYPSAEPTTGALRVRLFDEATGLEAAGSPATVGVQVAPEERSGLRRVLWMREEWIENAPAAMASFRSGSDPYGQAELGDLLAGPPHYFAHREAFGPLQETLESYNIVVLGAAAASRGAVTRLALLDYVTRGGALLLVGECLGQEAGRELTHWLSPLGVQLDTSIRVDGVFAAKNRRGLCRHWDAMLIRGGCAVYADDPAAALVPAGGSEPRQAVFVARAYGQGRVAVLSAGTPLDSHSLRAEANRSFAADLFRWLAGANRYAETQDMDSDGLSDATEDCGPSEGTVEPGETDYLDPDTDGDGIPDGLEDANLNGHVDEGETSPLNPDSDGDGILDGADATPLPPADAPHVARVVSPPEGPAEGGGIVQVAGRNFPPDATVWFGDRLSPSVYVLAPTMLFAEVPAHDRAEGGEVGVRVVNPASRLEGSLPGAFRYTRRSKVRLVLQTLDLMRAQEDVYTGALSIRLECPRGVFVEQVGLLLRPEPLDTLVWREFTPEPAGPPARRRAISRQIDAGKLLVVVMRGERSGAISGELGRAPWQVTLASEGTTRLRFVVEKAWAALRNRQLLEVSSRALSVALRRARNAGEAPPG